MADTDAVSYVNHSVSAVLTSAEEKKCNNLSAAEMHHASFATWLYLLIG